MHFSTSTVVCLQTKSQSEQFEMMVRLVTRVHKKIRNKREEKMKKTVLKRSVLTLNTA